MVATPQELQNLQNAVNAANQSGNQAQIAAANKALADAKARK